MPTLPSAYFSASARSSASLFDLGAPFCFFLPIPNNPDFAGSSSTTGSGFALRLNKACVLTVDRLLGEVV